MPEPAALGRARADIAADRLWKARDRLHGLLNSHPRDQEALDLLGQVYFEMGDLPRAGRSWMLVEREDEETRAALAALEDRYRNAPKELLRQIPVAPPIEEYPEAIQRRVQSLRRRYGVESYEWPTREKKVFEEVESGLADTALIVAFLTLLIVPWLLGLVFAVILLFGLL